MHRVQRVPSVGPGKRDEVVRDRDGSRDRIQQQEWQLLGVYCATIALFVLCVYVQCNPKFSALSLLAVATSGCFAFTLQPS